MEKEGPGTGEKLVRAGIMASTGIPIGLGRKKKVEKTETKTEVKYFIDILLEDPLIYLRLDMMDFDFTALKDTIKQNLYGNFRTLILMLKENGTKAKLNRGAQFYTGNLSAREPIYRSLSNLQDECSWFISLYLLN